MNLDVAQLSSYVHICLGFKSQAHSASPLKWTLIINLQSSLEDFSY
ncbi:hypothetical protein NIES4106_18840 [Fischerella sp. NIES-4106]|nr:hypothetical protein NIES4106_18840 [Fischerella sp. NIES-4106]